MLDGDPVSQLGNQSDFVDGLLQIFEASLVLVPTHALDHAAFKKRNLVAGDELDRLNVELLIVRAINLFIEWVGQCSIHDVFSPRVKVMIHAFRYVSSGLSSWEQALDTKLVSFRLIHTDWQTATSYNGRREGGHAVCPMLLVKHPGIDHTVKELGAGQ